MYCVFLLNNATVTFSDLLFSGFQILWQAFKIFNINNFVFENVDSSGTINL